MADPNAKDKQLVANCLAGEPGAWKEFVQRYTPFLKSRLVRTASRRGIFLALADQDDLISKVWEDLLRNDKRLLRLYRPGASLDRWVLTIGLRRLVHFLWERGRNASLLEKFRMAQVPPDLQGNLPEAALGQQELQERFLAALKRIPPRERFAVRLFYWADWPHHRIAQLLQIPIHQVGPLLQSARKRLQPFLDDPKKFLMTLL